MKEIADTGFFVAFANRQDEHPDLAVEIATQVTEPLLTCEAVLAETAFHLRNTALTFNDFPDIWLRKAKLSRGLSFSAEDLPAFFHAFQKLFKHFLFHDLNSLRTICLKICKCTPLEYKTQCRKINEFIKKDLRFRTTVRSI